MLRFVSTIERNYNGEPIGKRYDVYRNNKLIPDYRPSNEDCVGKKKFCKFITREAVEYIEIELNCELTEVEKKQVFDFYYKGATIDLKKEIKEHKAAIKKLEARLKRMQ
jgi:hypothetical protein